MYRMFAWSMQRPPRLRLASLLSLAIVAVTMALSCGEAAAICATRHFYNHSDTTWHIIFYGNFGVGGGTCRPEGGPDGHTCDIKPGTTAGLSYPDFGGWTIRIMSSKYHFDKTLGAQGGCKIDHQGSTGDIAVNEPADGDVVTCGQGGWTC